MKKEERFEVIADANGGFRVHIYCCDKLRHITPRFASRENALHRAGLYVMDVLLGDPQEYGIVG